MPKIIRLVSQDVDGLFDNIFTDDIIVKPYSKIALHSLCAEINIEQIVIDAQNDEIQFKMVNSNPSFKVCQRFQTACVARGLYFSDNWGVYYVLAVSTFGLYYIPYHHIILVFCQ